MNDLVPRGRFGSWVPERMRESFDSIWDNFFNDFDTILGNCCYEKEDGDYVYQIEAPGFNKDNVTVNISDGMLEVKGERKIVEGERTVGEKTLNKRISVGNIEDAEAVIQDGIITITLKYPKKDVKEVKVVDVK
jgi:HSP20 family molecular chaperone IbpA